MALGAFAPFPFRLGGSSVEGLTAAQHARICADLVAAKQAAPLAVVTVTRASSTSVSIVKYFGQNGIGLANAPALAFNTGTPDLSVTLTFAPFTDPYGITVYPDFTTAHGAVSQPTSSAPELFQLMSAGNNVVKFTVFASTTSSEVSSYTAVTVGIW